MTSSVAHKDRQQLSPQPPRRGVRLADPGSVASMPPNSYLDVPLRFQTALPASSDAVHHPSAPDQSDFARRAGSWRRYRPGSDGGMEPVTRRLTSVTSSKTARSSLPGTTEYDLGPCGVDVEICHPTILTEDIQSERPGTIGAVRRLGRNVHRLPGDTQVCSDTRPGSWSEAVAGAEVGVAVRPHRCLLVWLTLLGRVASASSNIRRLVGASAVFRCRRYALDR